MKCCFEVLRGYHGEFWKAATLPPTMKKIVAFPFHKQIKLQNTCLCTFPSYLYFTSNTPPEGNQNLLLVSTLHFSVLRLSLCRFTAGGWLSWWWCRSCQCCHSYYYYSSWWLCCFLLLLLVPLIVHLYVLPLLLLSMMIAIFLPLLVVGEIMVQMKNYP